MSCISGYRYCDVCKSCFKRVECKASRKKIGVNMNREAYEESVQGQELEETEIMLNESKKVDE